MQLTVRDPARCYNDHGDRGQPGSHSAGGRLTIANFPAVGGKRGLIAASISQDGGKSRTASPASTSRSSSGSSTCSPDARWPFVGDAGPRGRAVALPEAAAPPLIRRPVWRMRK